MSLSKVEQEYWHALERLKLGKTEIIDTRSSRFKFTKDAVGREAGRGKGYVRYSRYPSLCDAIAEAEVARQKSIVNNFSVADKIEKQRSLKIKEKEKFIQFKQEYDLLMTEYLNVVRRNFELEADLPNGKNSRLVQMPNKRK